MEDQALEEGGGDRIRSALYGGSFLYLTTVRDVLKRENSLIEDRIISTHV